MSDIKDIQLAVIGLAQTTANRARLQIALDALKGASRELMTYDQVCALAGVDRSTVYRWTKNGRLTPRGTSGKRLFYRDEVSNLLNL